MEPEVFLINEVSGSYCSESLLLAGFQDKDTSKRCSSPKQEMPIIYKNVKTSDEMEEIRDDEDIGLRSEASQSVQTNNYMIGDIEDGKMFENYLIQAELETSAQTDISCMIGDIEDGKMFENYLIQSEHEASAQTDISCKSDCFKNRNNGEESLKGELSLLNALNVDQKNVDVFQKSSTSETVHPTVFGSEDLLPQQTICDGEVECFNEENLTVKPRKYHKTSCKTKNVSVTKKTFKKNASDDVKAKLRKKIMGKEQPTAPEKPPEKPPNIPNFDIIEGKSFVFLSGSSFME